MPSTYAHHFGAIDNFDLPCTQADCDRMWQLRARAPPAHLRSLRRRHARRPSAALPLQDLALLNLGRLLPLDLIHDVASRRRKGTVPLASAEGFIRQLLGWREFMRHLHEQTDGYRLLPARPAEQPQPAPGDLTRCRQPDQTP